MEIGNITVSKSEIETEEIPVNTSSLVFQPQCDVSSTEDNLIALNCKSSLVNDYETSDATKTFDEKTLQNDNYYEVVSPDGSIGFDGVCDTIESDENSYHDIDSSLQKEEEQASFLDLPFVPKYEFSEEFNSYSVVNSYNKDTNAASISVPHCHNECVSMIVKHNFDFSVPPPNYKISDQNSLTIPINSFSVNSSSLSEISNNESLSKSNICLGVIPSSPKATTADWLDANGDPIEGAFDNIKDVTNVDNKVLKSSKVEYVFSVRDAKNVQNSFIRDSHPSSDVNINSGFNANVLINTVAGLSEQKLKVDEEKKLYLASKNSTEYKAAVQANVSNDPSISKTVTENAKKELLNRFKRYRFIDKKNESSESSVPPKDEQKKTQEETALESQAVTEILKETQRGAARAKEFGALAWQKCPIPVTNKTFLRNTLVSTLREPYKPPNKRGRFHLGLHSNKSKSKQYNGDKSPSSSDDQSSRCTSGRSSRSRSHSYSSGSYSSDNDRAPKKGNSSWPSGPNQYYDDWPAYYGYQWYTPDMYNMYYNNEGWPADPYMYYGDSQAWQDYNIYYRHHHFGARGQGSRGRMRGWGRQPVDLRNYIQPRNRSHSRSRSFSPSLSTHSVEREGESKAERSYSRKRRASSHSKSRSPSKSKKDSKHLQKCDSKIRSCSPQNDSVEKKKKSKKKKKKHKRKSKHSKQKIKVTKKDARIDKTEDAEINFSERTKPVDQHDNYKSSKHKESNRKIETNLDKNLSKIKLTADTFYSNKEIEVTDKRYDSKGGKKKEALKMRNEIKILDEMGMCDQAKKKGSAVTKTKYFYPISNVEKMENRLDKSMENDKHPEKSKDRSSTEDIPQNNGDKKMRKHPEFDKQDNYFTTKDNQPSTFIDKGSIAKQFFAHTDYRYKKHSMYPIKSKEYIANSEKSCAEKHMMEISLKNLPIYVNPNRQSLPRDSENIVRHTQKFSSNRELEVSENKTAKRGDKSIEARIAPSIYHNSDHVMPNTKLIDDKKSVKRKSKMLENVIKRKKLKKKNFQ